VGLADFDGNGRPDYLLYNSSTRQTRIWYMDNNVRIGSASGPTLPTGWNLLAPWAASVRKRSLVRNCCFV